MSMMGGDLFTGPSVLGLGWNAYLSYACESSLKRDGEVEDAAGEAAVVAGAAAGAGPAGAGVAAKKQK